MVAHQWAFMVNFVSTGFHKGGYSLNIVQVLQDKFPNAINGIDYMVRDDSDGNGAYLDVWNLTDPKPTDEELQAAWDDLQANPPVPPKSEVQILGEQLVERDIQIMELESLNDTLGQQVVDHDIRLMSGGL
jgi:hypothetical protein